MSTQLTPSPLRDDATFRVLWVWAVAVALELAVGLVQRDAAAFPLPWLLGWGLAGAAGLAASRILLARRMSDMYDRGRLARRVAIVGAVAEMEALLGYLSHQDRSKEWDVVGLFAVGPSAVVSGKPVGTLEDLMVLAPALRLDLVLVALPVADRAVIALACQRLRELPLDVCVIPDVALGLPAVQPRRLGRHTVLQVWGKPLPEWRAVAKRLEDVVISSLLLFILAPLMLLVAMAIRLESPGPAILRQRRFGFCNKHIVVLKFRTMYHDGGDASGARATTPGDARVTPLGRFLRRTSFDELPQLWNVIRERCPWSDRDHTRWR